MLLVGLAEPYPGEFLLEMSRAFARPKHSLGVEWFISTNGPDLFHTPYPFPCHLFRGQNQYFEPCLPSLSRDLEKYSTTIGGMAPNDQARVVSRIAKSHWFAREVDKHPAIIWAKKNNYSVNRIGLAQHYELATSYMDLSHEFDVAAFFATCRLGDSGLWEPVSEGVGVIYIFDLAKSQRCAFKAEPVSLQPLPRPGEQKAWLVEAPLGTDFETHPAVSWMKFNQEESVSGHFLDLFDEGRALFPDDPIARVAAKIRSSSVVNEVAVDNILGQLTGLDIDADNVESIKAHISEIVTLGDDQENLMEQEDLCLAEAQWMERVETFGKNVTTRPIALQILPGSS